MKMCEVCGRPIASRNKRFCSYSCTGQASRDPRRHCEACGKELLSSQKRFCSRMCYNPPGPRRHCEVCDKVLLSRQKRFCSKACYGQWLHEHPAERSWFKPGTPAWNKGLKGYKAGAQHWHWKGGQRKHSNGYIEMKCPEHPQANCCGYVLQHRLVMEQHLGRYLTKDEVVHHINGDKEDNRIENLIHLMRSAHQSMHTKEWWVYVKGLIEADRARINPGE